MVTRASSSSTSGGGRHSRYRGRNDHVSTLRGWSVCSPHCRGEFHFMSLFVEHEDREALHDDPEGARPWKFDWWPQIGHKTFRPMPYKENSRPKTTFS